MFRSNKLKKFNEINHCFFSRKGGFSKGIYAGLNCGRGSGDSKKNILKNLDFVSRKMNVRKDRLILMYQTHSKKVVEIKKNNHKKMIYSDAMITKLKANTNEMEEMQNKVNKFLEEKETTISKLQTSVGQLKSDATLKETNIISHFDKFKNLKENFMKFKRYIDSNNLKISSLLKEKIDAIHSSKVVDAKTIFPKDDHKLLPKYTGSSEEINNQIEEDTGIIISRFLNNSFKEEYNKAEKGGSSDNKTTNRNIDLVLEEFSTTSSTSGGYSKNKVKMDTNSIKKRKRCIKKYK